MMMPQWTKELQRSLMIESKVCGPTIIVVVTVTLILISESNIRHGDAAQLTSGIRVSFESLPVLVASSCENPTMILYIMTWLVVYLPVR